MAPAWDSASDERVLRLDCRCPYSAAQTRLQILETQRAQMLTTRPGERLGMYRCVRCSRDYPITAGAYQRAA